MKKAPKFKIGQSVLVKGSICFSYDGSNNRRAVKINGRSRGLIVGACYRLLGRRDWDSDYGGTFYPSGSVLVWKIREGYLNKTIEALEEDIESLKEPLDIPWKYDTQWNDAAKKEQSEIMKREMEGYPRDEKGRFVPAMRNYREKTWEAVLTQ